MFKPVWKCKKCKHHITPDNETVAIWMGYPTVCSNCGCIGKPTLEAVESKPWWKAIWRAGVGR